MPRVRVNDIEMYYELHGAGDPVVLIQGLAANRTFWEPNLAGLVSRHRILLLDYRGSGDTDKPAMPYSTRMFADDIAGLMEALGLARAHVVGRSMGGCIAQWLGIAHPAKVRSLVLAATWGRADGFLQRSLRGWSSLVQRGGLPALFEQALLWCYTREFFEPEKSAELQALEALGARNSQPADAFARQSLAGQEHDALDRLGTIRAPTVVVVGEEDILTPPKFSRELAARIPGAELRVLPALGHAFYEQRPGLFNELALDFWAKH
jgi:pimeloyl-ACP methyl ester carboxylesterase